MARAFKLGVLFALLSAWILPAQVAIASVGVSSGKLAQTIAIKTADDAAECRHEDDPADCLAEVASKRAEDSEDEVEAEDEEDSDDESEDESEDDDNEDDKGSSKGGSLGSGGLKPKEHSVPSRVIKPKPSGVASATKPSKTEPRTENHTIAPMPLEITTDITAARASLLRTATLASSATVASDDYLPRIGTIGAHDPRLAGAGAVIASALHQQTEAIHRLRAETYPLQESSQAEISENEQIIDSMDKADFSDPAEEFMAKAAFGSAVIGFGAIALAANAIKHRRRLKIEDPEDYDYTPTK